MNGRWRTWLLAGLCVVVVVAAIYFPKLKRKVKTSASIAQPSEEQARRELTTPTPTNPSDPKVKVKMFWASDEDESALSPVVVDLALSPEPVLRAKQVLNTLLAGPVSSDLRTLPPDAALLAFYLLPDGTGVADFSEAFATSTPSGIESEQLAVDSIARTLEANVPQVKRLKILIHGQEVDTLAGHLDLTQMFVVNTKAAQPPTLSFGLPLKPPAAKAAPASSGSAAPTASKRPKR
jgi:spore germination protein GerM